MEKSKIIKHVIILILIFQIMQLILDLLNVSIIEIPNSYIPEFYSFIKQYPEKLNLNYFQSNILLMLLFTLLLILSMVVILKVKN